FTRLLDLQADGSFTLTNIPARTYNLAVEGSKWLRKVVAVDTTQGDVSGLSVPLLAGDVTGDNVVDIDDLGELANAFNTASGDPLYDANADLTCDGVVDVDDLGLLALNFNVTGDP